MFGEARCPFARYDCDDGDEDGVVEMQDVQKVVGGPLSSGQTLRNGRWAMFVHLMDSIGRAVRSLGRVHNTAVDGSGWTQLSLLHVRCGG